MLPQDICEIVYKGQNHNLESSYWLRNPGRKGGSLIPRPFFPSPSLKRPGNKAGGGGGIDIRSSLRLL